MQAILDRVFIKRDGYTGKLIVNEKMAHGTIVSIGPGIWRGNLDLLGRNQKEMKTHWYPTSLKVGQRVCFSLDKGEEHEIEGQRLVIMREWDIAGIIEDEQNAA